MQSILGIFCAALLALSINSQAQSYTPTYVEAESGQLKFGFSTPENMQAGTKYPIIIFLHGWSNNYAVDLQWYNDEFQQKEPSFVYTPRTPTTWGDWSGWWTDLSEPMTVAMQVLDSLIQVHPIDTNRIYVYGISMGGEGAFDLLDKKPGYFAAAMSVCGGGRPGWAQNISKTPFWMFHGSADNINPVALTEDVANTLQSINAEEWRYTRYEGYGHSIWNKAESEPSWKEWMFAHVRGEAPVAAPSKPIVAQRDTTAQTTCSFTWNDIRDTASTATKAERIWYYRVEAQDRLVGTTEYTQQYFSYTPSNADTVRIVAVNMHFKRSTPSNTIICEAKTSPLLGISRGLKNKKHQRIFNLLGQTFAPIP